jgi:hypothetical protein
MKIRSVSTEPFPLDLKRAYLPFVIESTCPGCGGEVERHLTEDYLSYPRIGGPQIIDFVHEIEEPRYRVCGRWSETVVIDFTIRPASGQP